MKITIILFASLFISSAQARQYIQCADSHSFDRYVINLDGPKSTFFYTNGVHLPDDEQVTFLTDLLSQSQTQTNSLFLANIPSGKMIITISNNDINQALSYLEVGYEFYDHEDKLTSKQKVSCFSSLHN